jgi:hypothetical protein
MLIVFLSQIVQQDISQVFSGLIWMLSEQAQYFVLFNLSFEDNTPLIVDVMLLLHNKKRFETPELKDTSLNCHNQESW